VREPMEVRTFIIQHPVNNSDIRVYDVAARSVS